jgi:hypothetical protein
LWKNSAPRGRRLLRKLYRNLNIEQLELEADRLQSLSRSNSAFCSKNH